MNNKCWYCNNKLGLITFEWEIPCECGATNFVKAHAGCFFEQGKLLNCKVCDKKLAFSESINNTIGMDTDGDEEEIL